MRAPTTWTILQNDDPNHLGLRCNAFLEHQMALITSGCVPFRLPDGGSDGLKHTLKPGDGDFRNAPHFTAVSLPCPTI